MTHKKHHAALHHRRSSSIPISHGLTDVTKVVADSVGTMVGVTALTAVGVTAIGALRRG